MFYKIQKNICKMKLNYLVKGIFPPMEKKDYLHINQLHRLYSVPSISKALGLHDYFKNRNKIRHSSPPQLRILSI